MKLRDIYDFIITIPAAIKASAEEEHDSKLRGL
jgi:hypothetical protein